MNEQRTATDLITRGEDRLNLEMPFSSLSDWITPNEQFYVRCHFSVPKIETAIWRLKIEGAVDRPIEFSLDQLQALPAHTGVVTMECAGNGRSFLEPKVKGVAWDTGAVGTARWTGVLLRDLLVQARVNEPACEAIFEGADRGAIKEAPKPPGEIHYTRSIPIDKARGDVLLAYAMNDEPLTPEHGFPLRAIVPGWFGMASVKWLQRIVLTETPFQGYYQSIDYTYWERTAGGLPTLRPLAEMRVKAQIARPAMDEKVSAGSTYRVHGAAWAADAEVVAVEVSADGGQTWSAARLLDEPVKDAWRFWEFEWKTPTAPTHCTLIARATDSAGQTQPRERVADYGTYMINQWLPTKVDVR